MTRTVAREIAVRLCFNTSDNLSTEEMLDAFLDKEYYKTLSEEDELYIAYPEKKQQDYIRSVVIGCCKHRDELDDIIQTYSQGWKITRISRIAVAILRTALYEIIYIDDIPAKVSINEAVELSKKYEESETVSFINGILGSYMRSDTKSSEAEASCDENFEGNSECEASCDEKTEENTEESEESQQSGEAQSPENENPE